MVTERDVRTPDGRTVRAYDSGGHSVDGLTLLWCHGSPQTGALLAPLLSAAAKQHIRLVSYARPGYGGSTRRPGRNVASAADDVAAVTDALGVGRFAVMGASGGGPHALACAAMLPDRVTAVVCLAGVAPFTGAEEWYAGMISPGGLRAATRGRGAREEHAAHDEFDPASFTGADWAALAGTWASLGADAGLAGAGDPGGLVDDDVAFVTPWGFELASVEAPVLLVQGRQDRVVPPAHAEQLSRDLRHVDVWWAKDEAHVSILDTCPAAMVWLLGKHAETSAPR